MLYLLTLRKYSTGSAIITISLSYRATAISNLACTQQSRLHISPIASDLIIITLIAIGTHSLVSSESNYTSKSLRRQFYYIDARYKHTVAPNLPAHTTFAHTRPCWTRPFPLYRTKCKQINFGPEVSLSH